MGQVNGEAATDAALDGCSISAPTAARLLELCDLKFGPIEKQGWGPRSRRWFGYFTPLEYYEATLNGLIQESTEWLDVGCGRNLTSNSRLGSLFSNRCRFLVGIDPDDNIDQNPFVHERAKCRLEEYSGARRFDLITFNMVAEHIVDPKATVLAVRKLIRPGGRVVIYTPNKWPPAAIVAALTPLRIHHAVKRVLWGAEERDTFPTEYRMNTRKQLRRIFEDVGLQEELFCYLDDCGALSRWRAALVLELCFWRLLRAVKLHYPETCLLGVYRCRDRSTTEATVSLAAQNVRSG